MQSKVTDHSEETVQLVRAGPSTCRPHSPRQCPWQGPLPHGVKTIMGRDALEEHLRPSYAEWASTFALLTNEFLAHVFEAELTRIKKLARGKWIELPFVDRHFCKVGNNYVWVLMQDSAWTVELCYPGADPDARILAIENMPVLCPDALWGARLALACYPEPPANLVWHPYW
jgi:hypothetical protein